jgi:site-specific DNA-methyltransferase (adenine-specific)
MLEINNIYNEDCIGSKGMCLIDDKTVDLVIADLPYGVTSQNKWDIIIPFEPLWEQYERIIKDDGVIVFTATQPFASMLIMSNPKLFRYDIIWQKNKSTGFLNANKMPLRSHEAILVFYKKLPVYNPQKTTGHSPVNSYTKNTSDGTNYGKTKQGVSGGGQTDRYPTSVWDIPVMNNDDARKFHPTQKPIELYEKIIKTYSSEGRKSLILDNVSGAGTIGIACLNTNRNFIGFEKDTEEGYFHKSKDWIKRHAQALGKDHLLAPTF